MVTTNDVYRKIKEISKRTATPRPQIMIALLMQELVTIKAQILPSLVYLKDLRLIQFDNANPVNVKLTLLGQAVTR